MARCRGLRAIVVDWPTRVLAIKEVVVVVDPVAVPIVDRPRMYGRVGLDPVLLPWSWAECRLLEARNYWIATTRPDGRPHTRPVWGVWEDGAFYFSTGSLAAENLRHSPELTITWRAAPRW